jgi:hypothetical protein
MPLTLSATRYAEIKAAVKMHRAKSLVKQIATIDWTAQVHFHDVDEFLGQADSFTKPRGVALGQPRERK